MEKEKLHRFFAGTTSIQEGMDIRAWMEASEENKRIFYKERKLFDALMVHDDQTTNNCISNKRIPKIIRQWLKIASVIMHHEGDRKSTRLNSSHVNRSRMPSSA